METSILIDLLVSFLSPLLPFTMGIIRWRKIDSRYYPVILVFGAATIAEFYRAIQLINYYGQYELPITVSLEGYNLYVLCLSILYTLFFKNMGLFGTFSKLPYLIISLFIITWLLDHFVLRGNQIQYPTKYFRLFYSLFLSLFAIQQINRLIINEKRNMLKNSTFLICCCLLFFFLPYIITEGVFLFNPKVSGNFYASVFLVRKWTNILIYLIFTLAVLWMPPKKPFIQLS